VFEKGLLRSWAALLREGGIDFCDLRKCERWLHGVMAQDFLGAGAEIAVVAEDLSEVRGILMCDLGDRAKENREANGENAFFAPGENVAAEEEGGDRGLVDRCGSEIVGHQANFFVLLGGAGDGFAQSGETKHGGRQVWHGATRRFNRGNLALA
jgi:hypothetical protein